MKLYVKNKKGDYIPIKFEKVVSTRWSNSLVKVKVGSDRHPVRSVQDLEEIFDDICQSDVLDQVDNVDFLITPYDIDFEVIENLKDLSEKYIMVRASTDDDLDMLGDMGKQMKNVLNRNFKKTLLFPTPITVEEFKDLIKIKERRDIVNNRRSNR